MLILPALCLSPNLLCLGTLCSVEAVEAYSTKFVGFTVSFEHPSDFRIRQTRASSVADSNDVPATSYAGGDSLEKFSGDVKKILKELRPHKEDLSIPGKKGTTDVCFEPSLESKITNKLLIFPL